MLALPLWQSGRISVSHTGQSSSTEILFLNNIFVTDSVKTFRENLSTLPKSVGCFGKNIMTCLTPHIRNDTKKSKVFVDRKVDF